MSTKEMPRWLHHHDLSGSTVTTNEILGINPLFVTTTRLKRHGHPDEVRQLESKSAASAWLAHQQEVRLASRSGFIMEPQGEYRWPRERIAPDVYGSAPFVLSWAKISREALEVADRHGAFGGAPDVKPFAVDLAGVPSENLIGMTRQEEELANLVLEIMAFGVRHKLKVADAVLMRLQFSKVSRG